MPRFRLHTLLIVTLLCAIGIALGNAAYSRGKAKLIDLSPRDVEKLFPPAEIVEDNGRFRLTLRSRYQSIANVAKRLELNQLILNADALDRHQITFESYEREALQEVLSMWPKGDTRTADGNTFVVSGRVENQDNRALVEASVTLLRGDTVVGKGSTRRDGTFTISFEFTPSNRYQLRVDWPEVPRNGNMSTRHFAITNDTPERLVRIRVQQ